MRLFSKIIDIILTAISLAKCIEVLCLGIRKMFVNNADWVEVILIFGIYVIFCYYLIVIGIQLPKTE